MKTKTILTLNVCVPRFNTPVCVRVYATTNKYNAATDELVCLVVIV